MCLDLNVPCLEVLVLRMVPYHQQQLARAIKEAIPQRQRIVQLFASITNRPEPQDPRDVIVAKTIDHIHVTRGLYHKIKLG